MHRCTDKDTERGKAPDAYCRTGGRSYLEAENSDFDNTLHAVGR